MDSDSCEPALLGFVHDDHEIGALEEVACHDARPVGRQVDIALRPDRKTVLGYSAPRFSEAGGHDVELRELAPQHSFQVGAAADIAVTHDKHTTKPGHAPDCIQGAPMAGGVQHPLARASCESPDSSSVFAQHT
jgi:hypothetical protein